MTVAINIHAMNCGWLKMQVDHGPHAQTSWQTGHDQPASLDKGLRDDEI